MARPSLADLTGFAAVAEHRSFRRAAEELGLSRSALSHAVRSLEAQLGVQLLHRTTRSVAPTEAGREFLTRLTPALRELDEAVASAAGTEADEPRGALRISTGESGARWIVRHVAPVFLSRHPQARLDLVTDGRLVDIVAEGFDAGVRLAEAVPQDMVATPLGGPVRFLAVASPAYLAEHGRPETPDDLLKHRCIRQRLPSGKPYRWEFEHRGEPMVVDPPGPLTLDHNGVMVEAACEGLGVCFVPEAFARTALDAGRLEPLLERWSPAVDGLRLYHPRQRHASPVLRAFIDVLRKANSALRSPQADGA